MDLTVRAGIRATRSFHFAHNIMTRRQLQCVVRMVATWIASNLVASGADAFCPWAPSSAGDVATPAPSMAVCPKFGLDRIRTARRGQIVSHRQQLTLLYASLWERLQLDEDDGPMWYVLNCVATQELDLLRQCRERCKDMKDVVKFVVPTTTVTRSHGARKMVTEHKVNYPGYVFAKLRLCPETYQAVQELDLCRSWMGTVNQKGYRKLPPAPLALNEDEIAKFGLEDLPEEDDDEDAADSTVIVDEHCDDDNDDLATHNDKKVNEAALKVYQGLKVDDMVKVTARGKFAGEDGMVRRLKDGRVYVRFYTYGSMYEEWLAPTDVRKLSNMEILQGLSGPSQPIMQREFDNDRADGSPSAPRRRLKDGDLRRDLWSTMSGGPRQRRQDRAPDRFKQQQRDLFGRTDEERAREEQNWNWYQNNRRNGIDSDGGNHRAGTRQQQQRGGANRGNDSNWVALGDVDSQWGRRRPDSGNTRDYAQPSTRRNFRENWQTQAALDGDDDWSAFVSSAADATTAANKKQAEDDDSFFDSLMADVQNDLKGAKSGTDQASPDQGRQQTKRKDAARVGAKRNDEDDDFFASLMSELQTEVGHSNNGNGERNAALDDDFFASLEAELRSTAARNGGKQSLPPSSFPSPQGSDDFFAQLVADVDDALSMPATAASPGERQQGPSKSSDNADNNSSRGATPSAPNLNRHTVPELKEMLRERGLKVSGKKAELIERLQEGS